MNNDSMTLRAQRQALVEAATAINAKPVLDATDEARFGELTSEIETLNKAINRSEFLAAVGGGNNGPVVRATEAPAVLKIGRGDTEARAVAHYLRTGDNSGLLAEQRASNATDMNVGTAADGGNAVPTGLYNGIVAKRGEMALYRKIGCMDIPGKGTTVTLPADNGTANVFVSTAEGSAFDLDGPVLAAKSMTLVKYTKQVKITLELLEDEDAKIMDFLSNYVGRALANTENSLLVTEALANGTSSTLASASAASIGDIPELVYDLKGEYADGASWIMKRATEGAYKALTGSNFQLVATPQGPMNTLWGFPIYNSEQVPAIGTGLKSSIFLNGAFIARREGPGMTMLRDVYSNAGTGFINLWFYTRLVYKVTVAEAVRYGTHP